MDEVGTIEYKEAGHLVRVVRLGEAEASEEGSLTALQVQLVVGDVRQQSIDVKAGACIQNKQGRYCKSELQAVIEVHRQTLT